MLANDGELRLRMGRAARELANAYSWEAFDERVRTRLVPVVAEALHTPLLPTAIDPQSVSNPSGVAYGESGRGRR